MGFLSDLFGTNFDRRLLDAVDADSTDVLSKNYRRNGLENTESHYGWYTCPKCGKTFGKSKWMRIILFLRAWEEIIHETTYKCFATTVIDLRIIDWMIHMRI